MLADSNFVRTLRLVIALVFVGTSAHAASWHGGGPDLGWVTSFLRPVGPEGPLYAGTYGGGIWKSADGGITWVEASEGARDASVWDLAAGNDLFTTLYAATEDRGILRSTGFSDTWREVNRGLENPTSAFAVDTFPLDPSRIVAGTARGAVASFNRGDVWVDSLRVSPVQPVRSVRIRSDRPRTVYYVGASEIGVQRKWDNLPEVITRGIPSDAFLFDLVPWPGDVKRFVVTDFDGRVWEFDGTGVTDLGAHVGFDETPAFYRADVTVSGTTPVVRVGADRGLFTSVDGGASWRVTTPGRSEVHSEIWEVLVDDPDDASLLLGGFVDGVLRVPSRSRQGVESNRGMRAAWVQSVDARDGAVLVGTAHGRLYRSDDSMATWTEVTGSLDVLQLTTVWVGDGSPWVVSTNLEGAYFSEDQGAQWDVAVLPDGATRLTVIAEADSGRLIAGSDGGLLESFDEGRTWSWVEGVEVGRPCFAVTYRAGRTACSLIRVGTQNASLLVSEGDGPFVPIPVDSNVRVFGLAFVQDPGVGTTLLVARAPSGGTNLDRVTGFEGGSWTIESGRAGPLGQVVEPSDLLAIPGTPRVAVATRAHGVWVSDDAGRSWSARNEGLPGLSVEDLAVDVVDADDVRLVIGTFARGAWTLQADDVVSVVAEDPLPEADRPRRTRVLAPAPNPFNPRTTIRWEQAEAARVEVELFDLRGRRLRSLLAVELTAGRHRIGWDGTDDAGHPVASGTYVARVVVGGRVHTTRLTLLR